MPSGTLLSVFTPTHNPKYLPEIYANLARQTHQRWEWVILPNAGVAIPDFGDPRVRVLPALDPGPSRSIGLLKRTCCLAAAGEAVVELDHDDYLSLDALAEIAGAIDRGADFVFSDFAEFMGEDNSPRAAFGADQGWTYYDVADPEGRPYKAAVSPPAEPPWLFFISHAPNHVRAWRTSVYRELGGHDPRLDVGDDYELVIRVYAAGKRIAKIDRCLYFYRVHESNTYRQKAQRIHEVVGAVYNARLLQVLSRWCDDRGLARVLVGPGALPQGFERILDGRPDAEVVRPGERLPLADSSAGVVLIGDALTRTRDLVHVMNEAWRVLAPQGVMLVNSTLPRAEGSHRAGAGIPSDGRAAFELMAAFCDDAKRPVVRGFTGAFMPIRLVTHFPTPADEAAGRVWLLAHFCAIKPGASHIIPWPNCRVPER
jgi:O-antigen biosynthesis protein